METTSPVVDQPVAAAIKEAVEVVDQVSAYGSLITNSMYLIVLGLIAVFIKHNE